MALRASILRLAVGFVLLLAGLPTQPAEPVVELGAGMHLIRAELAADDPARAQGLMFRKSLGRNAGMLFVFDQTAQHCMWMKNTFVPLSVAFLDERAAVINIADMTPHSEESHCATRPARYALEMNRGWFAARGIVPGHTIRGVINARP